MLTEVDSPLLDPPTRAVLVMALLAFVLLLLGLIVMIRLGARWTRRQGKRWRIRTHIGGDYNERGEPLVGGLPRMKTETKTDETEGLPSGAASDETLIENRPSGATEIE